MYAYLRCKKIRWLQHRRCNELFIHRIKHKITSTIYSNYWFHSPFYPNYDTRFIYVIKVITSNINIGHFDSHTTLNNYNCRFRYSNNTMSFEKYLFISYFNFSYFQFRKSRYVDSSQPMIYNVNSLY